MAETSCKCPRRWNHRRSIDTAADSERGDCPGMLFAELLTIMIAIRFLNSIVSGKIIEASITIDCQDSALTRRLHPSPDIPSRQQTLADVTQ